MRQWLCCGFYFTGLRGLLSFALWVNSPTQEVLAGEFDLSPLVKEGSAAEVLFDDPFVPAQKGKLQPNSGAGSIQGWVRDQNAIPMTDSGRPGNVAQVRGLGVSSEDADVQVFGISLNPPQGGGFDLSSFPQYLWDSYQFQMGPSLNLMSPMASAGTMRLIPWTESSLREREDQWRFTDFISTLGVHQLSVGAKKDSMAAVVGWSNLKVKGPSGMLTLKQSFGSQVRNRAHLLGTQLESESLGSFSPSGYSSPLARMKTARLMPIFQNEVSFSKSQLLKSTLFVDYIDSQYRDPQSVLSFSQDRVNQWGVESVFLSNDWKVGGGFREVGFQGLGQSLYSQKSANMQVSRMFISASSLFFEPVFQGVWVSGLGWNPQGTVGVRKEWGLGELAVFSRLSFSRKYPTLIDRFARYGDFYVGNPNLKPEKVWTGIVGSELKKASGEASVQVYAQQRQEVRAVEGNSVINLGNSYILGLLASGQWRVYKRTSVFHSSTLSQSRILQTGGVFPYIPQYLSVSGVRYPFEITQVAGEFFWMARGSSSVKVTPNASGSLPGYLVFDCGLQASLLNNLTLGVRLEDLFNHVYQTIKDYPMGRSLSVSLSGAF